MNQFDVMEETVKKICTSLVEEPRSWKFEAYTFKKRGTDVEYWSGSTDNSPIIELWNSTRHVVFSVDQGKRIREAYKIARQTQASDLQEKIMASMK